MKKLKILSMFGLCFVGVFALLAAIGDFPIGGGTVIFRQQQMQTGAYTNSEFIDLQGFNNVSLQVNVITQHVGTAALLKPQWADNTNYWNDEQVLVAGTPSGGELVYTVNSRVISFSLTNNNHYIERFNRLKRYFRVAARVDGSSTGCISAVVYPMAN